MVGGTVAFDANDKPAGIRWVDYAQVNTERATSHLRDNPKAKTANSCRHCLFQGRLKLTLATLQGKSILAPFVEIQIPMKDPYTFTINLPEIEIGCADRADNDDLLSRACHSHL